MPQAKKEKLFSIPSILFYLFSIVIFFFAVKYFAEIKAIERVFQHINFSWIALAILSQIGTYLSTAVVFETLLTDFHKKTENISLFKLFKIAIIVVFLNQAIPSGNVSGSSFLFDRFIKEGIDKTQAFFSIIMEILSFYIVSIFSIVLVLLIYFLTFHQLHTVVVLVAIGGVLFFSFLGFIVTLISRKQTLDYVKHKLSKIPFVGRYAKRINIDVLGLKEDPHSGNPWPTFFKYKRASLKVIFFQLCIFLCDTITVYALLHGLGIQIHFLLVFFGFILTLVIGALPISPGSLIFFEGAMTFFYTLVGVPFSVAIIATLLYRALSFWLPMPIGLFLYRYIDRKKNA